MGDHRAGSTGPTATAVTPLPSSTSTEVRGRRVARHAAEQRTSEPYVGRRVAQVAPPAPPAPPPPATDPLTYAGRRVAGRAAVTEPAPVEKLAAVGRVVGRRIALEAEPADELDDVSAHLLATTAEPTLEPYVGRRVARSLPLIAEPPVVPLVEEPVPEVVTENTPPATEPTPAPFVGTSLLVVSAAPSELVEESLTAAPALTTPLVVEQPVVEPLLVETALEATEVVTPVAEAPITPQPAPEPTSEPTSEPVVARIAPRSARPTGRRVASRRTRIPSLPLLAGVAVLAISTCGALRAMNPDLAGTADGHLSPASALSGSSAVGSANLLGGRGGVVSRDSDRQALSSASGSGLQAAADAQAKQRDATLAALRGQAEKRAAQIKLHAWVLPVQPGVYHLTARFGDYSSLWSHFHTGLDFAAPTGTPIMAVAGGTITEVGYSGAYGNRTIERLADGTELWYCHQNEFGTSVGATVKPGQVIGYVGSTGNVTGPHLHLEVHPGGGDPVDPYAALIAHGLYPGPPA